MYIYNICDTYMHTCVQVEEKKTRYDAGARTCCMLQCVWCMLLHEQVNYFLDIMTMNMKHVLLNVMQFRITLHYSQHCV